MLVLEHVGLSTQISVLGLKDLVLLKGEGRGGCLGGCLCLRVYLGVCLRLSLRMVVCLRLGVGLDLGEWSHGRLGVGPMQ